MPLFLQVLLICDEMKLIGREMFAIDGCKLPANVSREWSGTKEEFGKKVHKLEQAIACMLARHRHADSQGQSAFRQTNALQRVYVLQQKIDKIKRFLNDHDDKPGKGGGGPRKSNVIDNDSAKMKTSHGTLQGYDGVATVDAKHQVVVHAQAYGQPQEHDLLMPMVEGTAHNFASIGKDGNVFKEAALAADSGFHTAANVKSLFERGIVGYIADKLFRKRDDRFAEAAKYKVRYWQAIRQGRPSRYRPADFAYDPVKQTCICPAGKALYRNGQACHIKGNEYVKFVGPKMHCVPCGQRERCLRHPETTEVRQVVFLKREAMPVLPNYIERMKQRIDSDEGRVQYGRRMAIVEPVFGNITHNKKLRRFSVRGAIKVNIQWKLYCIVHNLLKIHRYGVMSGTSG
jgi:hypothetical protein